MTDASADKPADGTATGERYWIGFDLGGTKMLATVYDDRFQRLGSERKKTKGHEGVSSGLERINRTIEDALENAGVPAERLAGIGIGCPGPIDVERGEIIEAPNLNWHRVGVRDSVQAAFGCPVVVVNDVDAGVYGEYRFGAGRGAYCVIGVFPGTGIGGGCVYDGRIIHGRNITCMEIGHMPIMSDGPLSVSVASGTLESVASRLAISAAAVQEAYRGQAPNLRKAVGTDLGKIRSGILADAVRQGDKVIEQILREAGRHIGRCIGGLVHLLAPEVVVLGGGLVEAMPGLFVESVGQAVAEFVLPSFRDTYRIVPAELRDDTTVLGAVAWAKTVISAEPSSPIH
jgi:glucokinase